jgi:predicted transcriptional regulator
MWADLFKIWRAATEAPDPITRRERSRNIEGAGVADANAIPDIRSDGSYLSGNRGSVVRLRDSTDFIDLSSVTNRQSRYKEYERLRSVAEIETALNVFADESCVTADTLVATPFGYFSIGQLAKERTPDELFLVYCYDFKVKDYTLAWAFHPRLVKKAPTIKVLLDNGTSFSCTHDHRVLLRSGEWIEAGNLKENDKLMPFYRLRADQQLTKEKVKQFARVYTHKDGWKTERQFLDEWRLGKKSNNQAKLSKILRLIKGGLNTKQISDLLKKTWSTIDEYLEKEGFSYRELAALHEKFEDHRRVINIINNGTQDVYDLSVNGHENFATNTTIFHNCQIGEHGHLFDINCKSKDIKEELEFLFFHPKMLNMDRKLWNIARNLYMHGDHFIELVIDPEDPKAGILKIQNLPADSIYRIETIKSKLLEFQQSKDGPDYQSLSRVEVTKATPADLAQATAIRFTPSQIVHMRIGDDRPQFYPYGVSLIEAARGPAHSLRLMEDAMLVYRLSRAPERRVFYVDVGQMPPFKVEAFMERMKDTLRKRKVYNQKAAGQGPNSAVEERFTFMSQDEDFWIPIRPNTNTRVETLPGATALGEIDDALYFRNKLFIALQFPKGYMSQEDSSVTKVTASSLDVKFARLVERLQMSLADGICEIAIRHLELRGFPNHLYEDLKVSMTPPSHYRELSEAEVVQARFDRAMALKGSMLFADIDILTRILKIQPVEAKEIVARSTIQQLQQMKFQVMSQNPQLMGIGMPGQNNPEMGTAPGGPSPSLTGAQEQLPGTMPPPDGGQGGAAPAAPQQGFMKKMGDGSEVVKGGGGEQQPQQGQQGQQQQSGQEPVSAMDTYGQPPKQQASQLPDPTPEDIKKFNLDIFDYSKEMDEEEVSTED